MGQNSDTARESDDSSDYLYSPYTYVVNMFLPAVLSFGILVCERGRTNPSRLSLTATCINPVIAVIANLPAG